MLLVGGRWAGRGGAEGERPRAVLARLWLPALLCVLCMLWLHHNPLPHLLALLHGLHGLHEVVSLLPVLLGVWELLICMGRMGVARFFSPALTSISAHAPNWCLARPQLLVLIRIHLKMVTACTGTGADESI